MIYTLIEQTTQDAVRHSSFDKICVTEKTPGQRQEFFLYIKRLVYHLKEIKKMQRKIIAHMNMSDDLLVISS